MKLTLAFNGYIFFFIRGFGKEILFRSRQNDNFFFFYNHFHIVYVLMKHKFELSSKERAFLSPSGNSKVFLIVFTALHSYFTTAVVMHSFEIVFL